MDKDLIPDRTLLFVEFVKDVIGSYFVFISLFLFLRFYWGIPQSLGAVSLLDIVVTVVVSGVSWVLFFYPSLTLAWGVGYIVSPTIRNEWISIVDAVHN